MAFRDRDIGSYKWIGLNIKKSLGTRDIYNFLSILTYLFLFKIKVVHAHGAKAGLYARLAKLFKWNLSVIYSPHGGAFHRDNQGVNRRLIILLESFLDKLTNELVFESKHARNIYIENIKNSKTKYSIIYNSVEPKIIESRASYISCDIEDKRKKGLSIITLIGRIRKIKGHDLLISALKKTTTPTFVYFVGTFEDDYKEEIKSTLEGVEYCFWGDESDVSGFYIYSDVLVVPSRAESFGYVAVEASLFDCVIVASNIPPFLETLSNYESVYFFETENPDSLATALSQALQTSRPTLNHKSKSNFTLTSFIRSFDKLYVRLFLKSHQAHN